jgi:hypothetical protein
MPKKTVTARPPDDVPLWDELVAVGDPRPYEPLTIPASLVVPDDAFADVTLAFQAAWSELDRAVDDAFGALDDVDRDAVAALDAVYAWPIVADAPTVAGPALALLDVETTVVLPVWPSLVDEEATS